MTYKWCIASETNPASAGAANETVVRDDTMLRRRVNFILTELFRKRSIQWGKRWIIDMPIDMDSRNCWLLYRPTSEVLILAWINKVMTDDLRLAPRNIRLGLTDVVFVDFSSSFASILVLNRL